ncbi:hypothetical protein HDU83_007207 [Entophlyctis luteolus]|nr:hypothetical protein HDU83_007207 [Entophlyctis luteolus]
MSDQNVVSGCCTAVIQLAYIVAYSVALARGDSPDEVSHYLIGMLVATILSFVAVCQIWLGLVSIIVSLVFFILGWIWFVRLNGMDIVQFYQTFGANEWLGFPLGTRILYFNLWATIAAFVLIGLLLVISVLFCGFEGVSEWFSAKAAAGGNISHSKPRAVQEPDIELGRGNRTANSAFLASN